MKFKNLILLLLIQLMILGCSKDEISIDYYKPVITTLCVSEIANTTAICGGNIISDGGKLITAKGLVWHTSANLTLEINTGKTTDGVEGEGFNSKSTNLTLYIAIKTGSDDSEGQEELPYDPEDKQDEENGDAESNEFTNSLTGLTLDTKYYVRAYATNDLGTVYGEVKEFTTANHTKPVITTLEVSEITLSTTICGGNISSDGGKSIISRGLVWDISSLATLESNIGIISEGTEIGEFTSKLTGLSLDTKYFVRAYATNELGIVYGEEKEFTTRLCRVEMLNEDVALLMTPVQGGTFEMGSMDGRGDEKPIHTVSLSSFEIGKYEVTQGQWKAIMDGANPSFFKGDNLPVEDVSWNDIQIFISKLNEQTGLIYRLPTEAEWEFAARGGSTGSATEYSGSNTIEDVAWNRSNSEFKTHDVGGKQPNELGIFDMTGNVWEWCNDWYSLYESVAVTNPQGLSSGFTRVYRGGGWGHSASYSRIAIRDHSYPSDGLDYIGFRLARSIE